MRMDSVLVRYWRNQLDIFFSLSLSLGFIGCNCKIERIANHPLGIQHVPRELSHFLNESLFAVRAKFLRDMLMRR